MTFLVFWGGEETEEAWSIQSGVLYSIMDWFIVPDPHWTDYCPGKPPYGISIMGTPVKGKGSGARVCQWPGPKVKVLKTLLIMIYSFNRHVYSVTFNSVGCNNCLLKHHLISTAVGYEHVCERKSIVRVCRSMCWSIDLFWKYRISALRVKVNSHGRKFSSDCERNLKL